MIKSPSAMASGVATRRSPPVPSSTSPSTCTTPMLLPRGASAFGLDSSVTTNVPLSNVVQPRALASRETASRRSDRSGGGGSSRPGTRERALTPAQVQKQTYRMRINVASLTPAHFEGNVTRYSPPDDLTGFLPSLLASRPMTRSSVAPPSRPHTVVSRLDDDGESFGAPVVASVVAVPRQPSDGKSALSLFFFSHAALTGGNTTSSSSGGVISPTATAAAERVLESLPPRIGSKLNATEAEFPTLTRVDVLRRRRRPIRAASDVSFDCERCATPFGLQMMTHRISTAADQARSRSSVM